MELNDRVTTLQLEIIRLKADVSRMKATARKRNKKIALLKAQCRKYRGKINSKGRDMIPNLPEPDAKRPLDGLLTADTIIERAAKALFESKTHPMLEAGGYPTKWEAMPRVVKKDYRRQVRIVIKAATDS